MTRPGLARFTTAGGRRQGTPGSTPAEAQRDSAPAEARHGTAPAHDRADARPPGVAPDLARFLSNRPAPMPGESCDLCAEPVPSEHRHVVDLERRSLLCTCQGCSLLFSGEGTGRYRMVPDRYVRVAPFALPPAWAALSIPVGIAFVIANTQLGRHVAFYPSPGGATESELPLDAWQDVVAANPGLRDVEHDVEAVLVQTGAGEPQCYVVPVDRCYELVGALRLHWRGFDGGQEVREHIAAFFADVERRSRPATSVVHPRSGPLTRPPSKVLRAGEQPPQAEYERPLGRDDDRDEARAPEAEV